MQCQHCGQQQATTHIKTIVNGELAERHLCSQCAGKEGYGNLFKDFEFPLNQFIGSFLGGSPKGDKSYALTAPSRCPHCGASFADIARSGKVGCGACYERYYSQLLPLIHRIHGKTVHNGRTPGRAVSPIINRKNMLAQKRGLLKDAINAEKYEEAAGLRDEIKALEKELNGNA